MMSNLEKAEEIAERLRQERYALFRNNCVIKSKRFKQECKALGIPASVVVGIGTARVKWLGHWLTIPVAHGWGEVEGRKFETSRPPGTLGILGIEAGRIKPVISIRVGN